MGGGRPAQQRTAGEIVNLFGMRVGLFAVIGCWGAGEQKFCIRATEAQNLVKKTHFRPMGAL